MSYFFKYFVPENFDLDLLKTPPLSPIYYPSFLNLPPSLVVPAEVDVLRDEGIAYAKKLKDEGNGWVELWLAKGVPHPFPHQYAATEVAVEFRELAIKRMIEAFEGNLKGKTFISNIDV
jgi:acetyl esterase/lipase